MKEIERQRLIKEIEIKVKWIAKNRAICEDTIYELNNRIDADYVKQSEFIENNTIASNVTIDENVKFLRAEPWFLDDLPEDPQERRDFLHNLKFNYKECSLAFFKKNDAGEVKLMTNTFTNHLWSLSYALRVARDDQDKFVNGETPLLQPEFIEEVNSLIFHDTEFDGVPGYGKFRNTMYYNGDWLHLNVKVKNGDNFVNWTPSDSDAVYEDMNAIIDEYNKSDLHPIERAVKFKVDFIRIHPFRDGNGRTARILLNYMLVRYGYPTITIRGSQKQRYFNAMNKAIETGDYTNLYDMVLTEIRKRCDKYIGVIEEQKAQINANSNDLD